MKSEQVTLKRGLKNISYTVWANAVSTIISVVLSLLIPKVFSVTEYGMWQLYSFYIIYAGLLHFGWVDGIYLKFGGYRYEDLPKQYLCNQFWLLSFFELILSFVVIVISLSNAGSNIFIWVGFSLCFLINSSRLYILLVYQACNKIKEYSKFLKLDRYIFFVLTVIGVIIGVRRYEYLILADLLGKLIALIISINGCKDYILKRPNLFTLDNIKEAASNISIGSKLTFGGLASSLVIGVLRQTIQMHWGIDTFARISLTLNISNMIMIFVNTIGQVLFPLLRTMSEKKYSEIFIVFRTFLSVTLVLLLSAYFVGYPILLIWLPQYTEGLKYMALLFPVFVFESKSALLYASFLKTIRQEKWILIVNLITLSISIVTIPVAVFVLDNLFLAVLFYVVACWTRNIISDIKVSKILDVDFGKELISDTMVITLFIIIAWNCNAIIGLLLYLGVVLINFFIQKNKIIYTIRKIKKIK